MAKKKRYFSTTITSQLKKDWVPLSSIPKWFWNWIFRMKKKGTLLAKVLYNARTGRKETFFRTSR